MGMTPAERKVYLRDYKITNKEKLQENNKIYRRLHPEQGMLAGAKKRAKMRGTEFTITTQDLVVPDVCPVLNIPIVLGVGKFCWNSPTVDEVRVGEGYTPENSLVMSFKANAMKSDATPEELLRFADWVYVTFGGDRDS